MTNFNVFICKVVVAIVNPLILLMSAVAFAYFLFGVAKFVLDRSQGEEAADGKSSMLWGIVGLAVIFGAYGIINISLVSIYGSSNSGVAYQHQICTAPTAR